jgi:hypothetical protein
MKKLAFSFLILQMLVSTQIALAEHVKKPNGDMYVMEGLQTLSSIGEIAAGVGIALTGAGTAPGVIIAGKGVLDLAVNVKNIIGFMKDEMPEARSALGLVARKVTNNDTVVKVVDIADGAGRMILGLTVLNLPSLNIWQTTDEAKNLAIVVGETGAIAAGLSTSVQGLIIASEISKRNQPKAAH